MSINARYAIAALALAGAAPLIAGEPAEAPSPDPAPVTLQIAADEADQGVASDGTYIYAIDNDRIGKYEIATGKRVDSWKGDPALFPHMNSCTVVGDELVCAASNYPHVPHTSAVEFFSLDPLQHVRSVSLGFGPGSLTVLDRHEDAWWAVFANYDGRGGVPGRGHDYTMLVKLGDDFRPMESWAFPETVLGRFAPRSASGASWGDDGLLYVSGHDRPEIYALALPEAGSTLRLVETLGIASDGQAIDWDPVERGRLWSIGRKEGTVYASDYGER